MLFLLQLQDISGQNCGEQNTNVPVREDEFGDRSGDGVNDHVLVNNLGQTSILAGDYLNIFNSNSNLSGMVGVAELSGNESNSLARSREYCTAFTNSRFVYRVVSR